MFETSQQERPLRPCARTCAAMPTRRGHARWIGWFAIGFSRLATAYSGSGKARGLTTLHRQRRFHSSAISPCLSGVGHDRDGPNVVSSDASNPNFRTLRLPGRRRQTTAARGRFAYERHRPAIAHSRIGTGTPSAVPSSSNFLASRLGSKLGLIAQSCRAFFISARVADLHERRNDIVSQQSGTYAVVVYRARCAITRNSKR
jgi:hypothetical protein